MKKIFLILSFIIFLGIAQNASAHLPRIVDQDSIAINNPEISQAFYGTLNGKPAEYIINSDKNFKLYINLLVPELANRDGRYSANVFLIKDGKEELVAFIDGASAKWEEMWEEFGRDYYLKGPEFQKDMEAGTYKIIVSGNNNQGKYVLVVGEAEKFTILETLKVFYVIPWLKIYFFNSPILEFFKTPFVLIGGMLLLALIIIIGVIVLLTKKYIKSTKPKSIIDE
jgi:hypothetical protein